MRFNRIKTFFISCFRCFWKPTMTCGSCTSCVAWYGSADILSFLGCSLAEENRKRLAHIRSVRLCYFCHRRFFSSTGAISFSNLSSSSFCTSNAQHFIPCLLQDMAWRAYNTSIGRDPELEPRNEPFPRGVSQRQTSRVPSRRPIVFRIRRRKGPRSSPSFWRRIGCLRELPWPNPFRNWAAKTCRESWKQTRTLELF